MSVPQWWQNAVGYQIYPRSFADANGDGIGDLQGIIDQLDYLAWLGINAIWISPFYPSPGYDVGYDISDYEDIAPEYGTLADFDTLIAEAHARDIRIIIDVVLNHSSHQHPWFEASRSSKDSRYRDWYIWRDGKGDQPPNDWEAVFGGSAWEYDAATEQYYYHFFLPEQPDLNWRNPEVEHAMFDMLRFWFDRGVDGLRLDAIDTIYEHPDLPNANVPILIFEIWQEVFLGERQKAWTPDFLHKTRYQINVDENHDLLRKLRRFADREYPGRLLLGESGLPSYYGDGTDEHHSLFNFDWPNLAELNAPALRKMITDRRKQIPPQAWDCQALGNHDRRRSMGLLADGKHDIQRYILAHAITILLPGTPMIYYGEEIGMRDHLLTDPAAQRDGFGIWAYNELRGMGVDEAEALKKAQIPGRDKNRTPMQWSDAPNAGFSPQDADTWLPVHPNFAEDVNVAVQQDDPNSILSQLRRIIELRATYSALRTGQFKLAGNDKNVFAFWRSNSSHSLLMAFNCSAEPATAALGMGRVKRIFDPKNGALSPVQAKRQTSSDDIARLSLAPYELYVGML